LEAHIFTDKVIYRPNDVIFAEVLVLDAFNKTPIALAPEEVYSYSVTFDILDAQEQSIYQTYGYVSNSAATFTFKVKPDVVGGEYTLKATSYNNVAPALKLIRIRDYPRDLITVETDLPYESYRPGDTVSGKIKASTIDGSAFESAPTFSYSVSFDTVDQNGFASSSIEQVMSQSLTLAGEGFFTFTIPTTTKMLLTTIAFIV
jgi:uncharacterized protein YfaS (alpha-2-macroglobulin family)